MFYHQVINSVFWCFILLVGMLTFFTTNASSTEKTKIEDKEMNVIDQCWRFNPEWSKHRQQLVVCSVGYVGKMTNNIGKNLIHYKVTNPSDHPLNPTPGTLRYGASSTQGKVWITFKRKWTLSLWDPFSSVVSPPLTVEASMSTLQIMRAWWYIR